MSLSSLKNKHQAGRFALIGVLNTLIDFGLLFILRSLGLPVIPANLISSTIAFSFSFFANRSYTFNTQNENAARQVILFIIVTLTGLWVIQNIIIHTIEPLLSNILESTDFGLLLAKIIATAISLVWNYVFYSTIVFRNKRQ